MTLREKIISLITSKDYKGMTKEELAGSFNLEPKDYKIFFKCLVDMEREGLIYLSSKKKYLPNSDQYIEGVLEGTTSGFAFLVVKDEDLEDIFIPPGALAGAVHGDTVLVKITKEAEKGNKAEGQVVRLLSPVEVEIVGTLVKEGKYFFVEPNSAKYSRDIFIDSRYTKKAKHNDKVVVKLIKRAKGDRNPEGRVIEVIGNRFKGGVEITSIAREFDLRYEFPKAVEEETKSLPNSVRAKDLEGRTDFTGMFTVTIDGASAKDFDDAISIEKEGDLYRLYVHIADVAAYVKKASAIDEEAYKRGNSVYLLDRVIPMLPEEISNGLCSLQPNEIRLSHTVEMLIDRKGQIKTYEFYISYIQSDYRLIYDDVSDYLEEDSSLGDEILEEKIHLMKDLRDILHEKRLGKGALDFDIPESQVVLNASGKVEAIFPRERRIAETIIEEFMIACNETVAEHFAHMDYPFLYRIHPEPEKERVASFNEIIQPLGYSIKGQDLHAKDFQIILKQAEGKPEQRLISTLLLRTMKKARYSADLDKHFGLASYYYSHFTAPIRRYSDLVVHRTFKDAVNSKLTMTGWEELYADLYKIADHVSLTERVAEEAERQVESYMQAEYMKEVIGKKFYGTVSSLTSYGIYIQLENTVEGLASFKNQRDDYYIYDQDKYRVYGERSGKEIKIGMGVRVKVLGVDELRNEIDFELIEW